MVIDKPGISASFDNPVEMLIACHDRVRHFARLAVRLGEYLTANSGEHGDKIEVATEATSQAAEAATRILCYFDLAVPLHHTDEELDLFPALRCLHYAVLDASINSLQAEHAALETLWLSIRPWLEATSSRVNVPLPPLLAEFSARHIAHTEREEVEVFAAAKSLAQEVRARMGRNMAARRGAR